MGPEVKRALLVEPDYLHAQVAAANLEAAGFEVEQHTNACDAYLLLLEQQERFDIAVVTFPYQLDRRPDTVELLEHLRGLSMPRVVVSALDRIGFGEAFSIQEGEGYVEKPYLERNFREVVAEVLSER